MGEKFESLLKSYDMSNMVCFGSPDQFQYRQNQLLQKLVEYIIERDNQQVKELKIK